MAAPTVYTDVAEDFEVGGKLFAGKKFFVLQRVPTRNGLLDDIRANGGEIVSLESKADYMIADHYRRDCPPGTISYEFVTKSIREGELQDPEDHLAGPRVGEPREPGAINRPTKGTRRAYTAEEDRILYKWVRDAESLGGHLGGNEIYKQLEAKYPQHTWQSYRDRYLKKLQHRPASTFNIPDNAPPSPPSDKSNELLAQDLSSSRSKDYNVDHLTGLFTTDDWEELYAFVDHIQNSNDVDGSWIAWAEAQGNQTADQWRQYYEKVVRPQWLRDPRWKREKIKEKIERKHAEKSSSQAQPASQEQRPDLQISENTTLAQATIAPKATETTDASKKRTLEEADKLSSEVKQLSSSTARPESPKFVKMYEDAMKRLPGTGTVEEQEEEAEMTHPLKRRKMTSATPIQEDDVDKTRAIGTHNQPLEISSTQSSTSASESEAADEALQEQVRAEVFGTLDDEETIVEHDDEETKNAAESIESDDYPDINQIPPPAGYESVSEDDDDDDDNVLSNSPTPRATRQKISDFNTQAILSSPIRDKLTRHNDFNADDNPPSDASTTQSLQEFRRSLNSSDLAHLPYTQPHRQPSLSPAPSTASITSTSSGDPDPPLQADEIDDFFTEQRDQGFSNEFIVAALRRTRLRPELAVRVLDAWQEGKELPYQRGVWSREDDDMVESGDGVELARLERKHTLDGWGGITERLVFLEANRR